MEEYEVIHMLQRYRHDIANHLQLISGYLAMDRIEKVEDKIEEWVSALDTERKLYSLDIPRTTIWLLQFATNYESFRLTYEILLQQDIKYLDDLLYESLNNLTAHIENLINPLALYDVFLTMEHTKDKGVQVIYKVSGEFPEKIDVRGKLKDFPVPIEYEDEQTKKTYRFTLI